MLQENVVLFGLLITLVITFFIALLGKAYNRNHSKSDIDVYNQGLNKWLVALSSGATANSGFIVTGAVGLGYMYGLTWVLLPLAWLLGDLLFWSFFPDKINDLALKAKAKTPIDLMTYKFKDKDKVILSLIIGSLVFFTMIFYLGAQLIAGQKFIQLIFPELNVSIGIVIFTLIIMSYSVVGGFRGSVYADVFHALIGLVGITVAITYISYEVYINIDIFNSNIASLPNQSFLSLFGEHNFLSALGFILGFAFAAIGFGLGQPQIVNRYMAAKSPNEIVKSKWIYIGFVQYTWVSMTIFGVLLRGLEPGLMDAESGLFVYFEGKGLIGIVIALTIFAVIASTTNSLAITLGHITVNDLIPRWSVQKDKLIPILTAAIFLLSLVVAITLKDYKVFDIVISSVTLLGSALGGAMIIVLFNLRYDSKSLILTILTSIVIAVIWKQVMFGNLINEAFIAILSGLVFNYAYMRVMKNG